MAVDGLDILKDENGDEEHKHVMSAWMNYQNKPKPSTEYRVCQVTLPNQMRCPHYEIRNKAMA